MNAKTGNQVDKKLISETRQNDSETTKHLVKNKSSSNLDQSTQHETTTNRQLSNGNSIEEAQGKNQPPQVETNDKSDNQNESRLNTNKKPKHKTKDKKQFWIYTILFIITIMAQATCIIFLKTFQNLRRLIDVDFDSLSRLMVYMPNIYLAIETVILLIFLIIIVMYMLWFFRESYLPKLKVVRFGANCIVLFIFALIIVSFPILNCYKNKTITELHNPLFDKLNRIENSTLEGISEQFACDLYDRTNLTHHCVNIILHTLDSNLGMLIKIISALCLFNFFGTLIVFWFAVK